MLCRSGSNPAFPGAKCSACFNMNRLGTVAQIMLVLRKADEYRECRLNVTGDFLDSPRFEDTRSCSKESQLLPSQLVSAAWVSCLAGVLRSCPLLVAWSGLKTLFNGWCTSARMNPQAACPACLFQCCTTHDQPDSLFHVLGARSCGGLLAR